MAQGSPTVCQRELGMRLRELRHSRDLTVEEVADKLLCSASKISRIETGARRPTSRDVRDLCSIYGADPARSAELMDLARGARQPGWWTQYDNLEITPFIGIEQEATCIMCFGMYSLQTLLQTKDYAQAIFKGITSKIELYILSPRVEPRLRRQARLKDDNPPHYEAFLDEAVLYRQVDGTAVMRSQLEKILRISSEGRVTVQVTPFEAGACATEDSDFDYLESGDSPLPGLVFVEGLARHLYLDQPADLERYREAVEHLRDAALTPRESVKRIEETRGRFASSLL